MKSKKFKNIIFDLGRIIIDLDFPRMSQQFEAFGVENFGQYFDLKQQNDFFEALELGTITIDEFCDKFRERTSSNLTNEQIEAAWNALLEDFVPERMALLEKLSKNYNIYLFSNTNAIHAKYFEAKCIEQMGETLQSYFKVAFYSHTLHMRKPEVEAFQKVLEEAGLKAEETLFIDDNADNIKGASLVGLQVYHLESPETLTDIDFSKL